LDDIVRREAVAPGRDVRSSRPRACAVSAHINHQEDEDMDSSKLRLEELEQRIAPGTIHGFGGESHSGENRGEGDHGDHGNGEGRGEGHGEGHGEGNGEGRGHGEGGEGHGEGRGEGHGEGHGR
jgi:hypothetical protein